MLALLSTFSLTPRAHATPADDEKLLRSECDALLKDAVRRPYGIGWERVFTNAPGQTPRQIWMGPRGTPAAGLLLFRAGKLLNEPRYTTAAMDVARGIMSSQYNVGRIPMVSLFAVHAGGVDPASTTPDRAATRAAMGLLLTIADRSVAPAPSSLPNSTTASSTRPATTVDPTPELPPVPEPIQRSAVRATQWLFKQRTLTGAWPTTFETGATRLEYLPIMRLDEPDFHHSTIALLLSGQVLNQQAMINSAQTSVGLFDRLRIAMPTDFTALWATAYVPDGSLFQRAPDLFMTGPDLIATRRVMATMLVYQLLTDDSSAMPKVVAAANTIEKSRRIDNTWELHLRQDNPALDNGNIFGPASAPTTRDARVYEPFGLDPMLSAVKEIRATGIDRFRARVTSSIPLRDQIASALVGLEEDPINLSLPRSSEDIPAYLAKPAPPARESRSVLETRLDNIHRLTIRLRLSARQ